MKTFENPIINISMFEMENVAAANGSITDPQPQPQDAVAQAKSVAATKGRVISITF